MDETMPKSGKTLFVYEKLKNSILANEYRPGQIISENSLVKKLGISRTPVREAVKILESEGLVQIYKGVGVLVRHVTIKEIQDACEVRVLLECYAMKRAAQRFLPWQIDQMIDRWKDLLYRIETSGDYTQKEITDMDIATHDLVFENAGNDVLSGVHNSMHEKIIRYQAMFTKLVNDDVNSVKQHIDLLEALKEKDEVQYQRLLERQVYGPISYVGSNFLE